MAAGVTPKTLNNELGYLSAVFSALAKSGEISFPNPLTSVDRLKIVEHELAFLTDDQISELLAETRNCDNPHVTLICKVCLSTGSPAGSGKTQPTGTKKG